MQGSRGRERSSKPIQAFAIKLPASASGMSEGKPNRARDTLALSPHGLRTGMRHAIRHLVAEKRKAGRPPAAAMQGTGSGAANRCRHRDPRRSVSLACPLSDMSQFAAELCEYCADIAPIVPSLRNVP